MSIIATEIIKSLQDFIKEKRITREEIASKLEVNAKTISQWLKPDEKNPISLINYIRLCQVIKQSPINFWPNYPEIKTFERQSNPLVTEKLLLELEQKIPINGYKKVIFSLFSSLVELPELTECFLDKGFYRKRFENDSVKKQFWKLRKQRIENLEKNPYKLQQIFMRDEFENWVNGARLFHRLSPENKIQQLKHIINIFDKLIWDDESRIEFRMTKSFFRSQYALYDNENRETIVMLNTNSNYVYIKHHDASEFYLHEFRDLWDNGTFFQLRSKDEWSSFFEKTIKFIEIEKDTPRKMMDYHVHDFLE